MSKAWSDGARKAFLLLATFLTSATLAAAVRSFVVSDYENPAISQQLDISGTFVISEKFITSEQPAIYDRPAIPERFAISGRPATSDRRASVVTSAGVVPWFDGNSSFAAVSTKAYTSLAPNKDTSFAPKKHAVKTPETSYGLASYYSHTRTASGEKPDARDLTAAHRTLPFGTRVRVTNLSTGQSVTVRINDRGPFVRGRIVDISRSAAEKLGLVERGLTRVKLEVIETADGSLQADSGASGPRWPAPDSVAAIPPLQ
jgi:rare lipoprotein A